MEDTRNEISGVLAELSTALKELSDTLDGLLDPTWPEHCYTAEEWAEIQARKGGRG